MRLTETELAFLDLVDRYDSNFDVTSARIGKALKMSAKSLLTSGHLTGRLKSLYLTDLGRAALAESEEKK